MGHDIIFLLGGRDLEMKIISEILTAKGIPFADGGLRWDNAVLSSYREELQKYGAQPAYTIYGVELMEDVTPPSNYIQIDHHNKNAHKPSSLEQIATLLDYPLSRYQKLAALNDALYIPGMQQAGASWEEIEQIRLDDRRAQGVTAEDEALAERSVEENKLVLGELIIVKSLTSAFSPICDRLYPYSKLLVYTDDELMYYGEGTGKLVAELQPQIKDGRVFHGGGEHGYIGVAKGSFTVEEIIGLKTLIQSTVI